MTFRRGAERVISERELAALADSGAPCRRELPVDALRRFGTAAARRPGGMLRARWTFARERQAIVADGEVIADVALRCQRCLEPYWTTLRATLRWSLARSDAEAKRCCQLYPEREPVLCAGGLDWAEAIEDELLLSLPTRSRHRSARCAGPVRITDGAPPSPFGAPAAAAQGQLASGRRNPTT